MPGDVREQPRVQLERPRCPFCHEGVEPDVSKAACDACMAWHHKACWDEGGGCGACGARSSAVAAATRPAVRVQPAARIGFQDSAQSAVAAHRSSTARARRPRRSPAKTAAFLIALLLVVSALVLGGFVLVARAGPYGGLVAGSIVVSGLSILFLRSFMAFRRRRLTERKARGGRDAR